MPEQYISIVVPGRMYAKTYRDMGLHPKTLSNALESSGTVLSPLVPWNTCGVFMLSVLGVGALEYAPYAIFNYSMPFVVIALAYLGVTVARLTPEEIAAAEAEERKALLT
jgi:NhaC family Na+:H+ antiporter